MRPTTVDAVMIQKGKVLLVKRKFEPYKGFWAIPGGFVEEGETVEEACRREAFEETGVKIKLVKFVGIYSDPKRDPRGTITAAFIAKPLSKEMKGDVEIEEIRWFKLDELPSIGFDHRKIIEDARRML
ncbi:NUDIX hydrolase [Candidatus Micrarchaeota archaeon]|nr:NUDIX hydrolase [Candidatus Micrarchaeota archaeon]